MSDDGYLKRPIHGTNREEIALSLVVSFDLRVCVQSSSIDVNESKPMTVITAMPRSDENASLEAERGRVSVGVEVGV